MAMKSARLLRSYPGFSAGDHPDATIWQAARATSAAPTFFKCLWMGQPGMEEQFIDGGMGCNNPTAMLLQEAARVYSPNRPVSCIVSIGTGLKPVSSSGVPDFVQRVIPVDVIKELSNMATDCEQTALQMKRRFMNTPDFYFRFNADQAVGGVGLEEWKEVQNMIDQTLAYLQQNHVSKQLLKAALSLADNAPGKCAVSSLAY